MSGYRTPEIVPYDPAWIALYEAEAVTFGAAIPGLLSVEHIGSTSVPGLAAKPIVDILAVVPSMEPVHADRAALAALGYDYRPQNFADDPLHLFFPKDIAGRRAVHLHVFAESSPVPAENLRFRDFMRASSAARAQYAEAKRSISGSTTTRAEYADAKAPVMTELAAAADAWHAAGRPVD
jgi:GrpB-like predicted nucleotidyltransferase (UPF0157 family)